MPCTHDWNQNLKNIYQYSVGCSDVLFLSCYLQVAKYISQSTNDRLQSQKSFATHTHVYICESGHNIECIFVINKDQKIFESHWISVLILDYYIHLLWYVKKSLIHQKCPDFTNFEILQIVRNITLFFNPSDGQRLKYW